MSDVQIHPTAIVDPGAEIGAGTNVGPYCVIGPDVVLGPDCWLQHHVTLCGPMKAGAKNKFYAYCSIGQQTQDLKYRGEPTYLEIGDENTFREFVTVNRSTTSEGKTRIGNSRKFSRLQSYWARLHCWRPRRFLQQRHTRRPRSGWRPRGNGRPHSRTSILSDRTIRHYRRLLENCPGRSTVHDRGRQPGRDSRR